MEIGEGEEGNETTCMAGIEMEGIGTVGNIIGIETMYRIPRVTWASSRV